MSIVLQPGGRFPTAAELLDHIFFVERRHLSRLQGSTPPEESGVPLGDWQRLFEYADLVRADFRRYVSDLTDVVADGVTLVERRRYRAAHTVAAPACSPTCSCTRSVTSRSWPARRGRRASQPPGNHDLFLFEAFD